MRIAPGPEGCADTLVQQARDLTALKRLAADASTPPSNLPSAITLKTMAGATLVEAWRVIDSMPDNSVLRSEDDLRPYIVALGRAWSALAMLETPPLGKLPGGRSRVRRPLPWRKATPVAGQQGHRSVE